MLRHLDKRGPVIRGNTSKSRGNWLLAWAIAAGLLASACCTLPLVLVLLSVGGARLSAFPALEPLRPVFVLVAMAGGLLLFTYRRIAVYSGPEVCEPEFARAKPATRRRGMRILVAAAC